MVRVDSNTEFTFTPSYSSTWIIYTTNNGSSDPYLEIYNANGVLIDEDDDGGEGYNASIDTYLEAGVTYTINARFWAGGSGSYDLYVVNWDNPVIPGNGGSVTVSNETTYTFTPNQSGRWEFRTTNNGDSDPMLEIYDSRGVLLAENDDGGDGLNSLIIMNLEAGTTYTIIAKFWISSTDNYTLNVTRG